MQKLVIFLLFMSAVACSTSPSSTSPNKDKTVSTTYTVINLGKEFDAFWEKAKSKPFEEQVKIWDEVVEAPHQDLYDSLVYSKKYSKDWPEKKTRRLKGFFAVLPHEYEATKKVFDGFENTVAEQIKKYSAKFPDSKFTNKIYAVPGATFNGKANELSQTKETVLAFGINIMIEIDDDPDVLYSHELFHIYHHNRLNIDEKTYDEKGKLTLPLWMEGLAVYVSKEMNPSKGDDKVFMSKDLPKVPQKDIRWMAEDFLKNADAKSYDEKHPEIYQNWFNFGKQIRKDIPTRAGYLLGYHVVKELGKKYSSYEMAGWDLDKMHKEVKSTLAQLSK